MEFALLNFPVHPAPVQHPQKSDIKRPIHPRADKATKSKTLIHTLHKNHEKEINIAKQKSDAITNIQAKIEIKTARLKEIHLSTKSGLKFTLPVYDFASFDSKPYLVHPAGFALAQGEIAGRPLMYGGVRILENYHPKDLSPNNSLKNQIPLEFDKATLLEKVGAHSLVVSFRGTHPKNKQNIIAMRVTYTVNWLGQLVIGYKIKALRPAPLLLSHPLVFSIPNPAKLSLTPQKNNIAFWQTENQGRISHLALIKPANDGSSALEPIGIFSSSDGKQSLRMGVESSVLTSLMGFSNDNALVTSPAGGSFDDYRGVAVGEKRITNRNIGFSEREQALLNMENKEKNSTKKIAKKSKFLRENHSKREKIAKNQKKLPNNLVWINAFDYNAVNMVGKAVGTGSARSDISFYNNKAFAQFPYTIKSASPYLYSNLLSFSLSK